MAGEGGMYDTFVHLLQEDLLCVWNLKLPIYILKDILHLHLQSDVILLP